MNACIVSAGDVVKMIHHENTVLVDARGGADAYERYKKAHIEGALFVNLETELSEKSANAAEGGRHPLPSVEMFGNLLKDLGITSASRVIVYDDKQGANAAARFWWMLKSVGHKDVMVLDGGLTAAIRDGLPITEKPTVRKPAHEDYPVKNWLSQVVTMDEVAKASQNPEQVVIDVREGYRYRGEGEPFDLIAGHIPGAVNIPYVDNLDPEGNFHSAGHLRQFYLQRITNHKPENVIVHCGSGVTACHTLLALEQAGITGAKLYVGSWSEWSRNEKPIATGDQ
ncbi:MAG: sulfurtransferase [Cyclobacteriaceae bacterium]|jgi:thiosulfate/3-mercaptopyruvate sulfurtransferase|nr:sulfurtransferase [Cyclobacteriaceae bacterium]